MHALQLWHKSLQHRATQSSLLTKDGARLFARAVLRDWSGSAEASFTEQAIPALFGLENKDEVMAALKNGALKAPSTRFNLRGVRRLHEGSVRFYIAQAEPLTYSSAVIPASKREVFFTAAGLGYYMFNDTLKRRFGGK